MSFSRLWCLGCLLLYLLLICSQKRLITVVNPSKDAIKIPPMFNFCCLADLSMNNNIFWIGSGATYHNVLYLKTFWKWHIFEYWEFVHCLRRIQHLCAVVDNCLPTKISHERVQNMKERYCEAYKYVTGIFYLFIFYRIEGLQMENRVSNESSEFSDKNLI